MLERPDRAGPGRVHIYAEGLARSGRSLGAITLFCPVMTAVGDSEEELVRNRANARTLIAFYGSTRTYSPVFEHHDVHGLCDELHALQQRGDVAGMKVLITDPILDLYTVTLSWNRLADVLVDRYRDLIGHLLYGRRRLKGLGLARAMVPRRPRHACRSLTPCRSST